MKLLFIFLVTLGGQIAKTQVLRPSPFNLLNRQEGLIETSNLIPAASPTVISEPPINSLVPIPNVAAESGTTLITDCSPTICKNLANTIQLMIVCNLLQNTKGGSDFALQLAKPIINEVMASPAVSCACANTVPTITPSVISPNIITPNFISPNLISPNVVTPTVLSPNIIGPESIQYAPRIVTPSNVYPTSVNPSISGVLPSVPVASQVSNANGLLNTLMSLLGNVQV